MNNDWISRKSAIDKIYWGINDGAYFGENETDKAVIDFLQSLPPAKENRPNNSFYEYAVFDGRGEYIDGEFMDRETAERVCQTHNANRKIKDCRVMQRLVMSWESVGDNE